LGVTHSMIWGDIENDFHLRKGNKNPRAGHSPGGRNMSPIREYVPLGAHPLEERRRYILLRSSPLAIPGPATD